MNSIQITSNSQIIRDQISGVIRSWFDDSVPPETDKAFTPRALARSVLEASARLFNWANSLPDLVDGGLIQGPNAYSVRFTQTFKGIPVDASEVVVNMYSDSRVHTIYNNYHYDIPADLDPQKIKIDARQARGAVEKLADHYENPEINEPRLIVYQYRHFANHPKRIYPGSRRETFLRRPGQPVKAEAGSRKTNIFWFGTFV